MASSSSSSSIHKWNYDVFLSFRGPDTRSTITGYLFQALHDKGINVFIDNDLERGEVITSQLLKVIEESRISIVVLSENYASSSFCLDELVKIFECRESKWQTVLPVFYHVDPTDVEEQKATFGQNFTKLEAQLNGHLNYWKLFHAKAASFLRYVLTNISNMRPIFNELDEHRNNDEAATENMEIVQKWRLALTEVARLSGWHLKEGDNESNVIQDIVKKVLKKLDHTLLHVNECPVGLISRVEYILQELDMESNDVRMLGLYGMGGVGKTTTAKALFNRCVIQFEFDGSCFLLVDRGCNLAQMQQNLLSEIFGNENCLIGNNFYKGIELIKKRLQGKKVLIVIDDVDCIEQLNMLVGGLEWFGPGSRIFITTRNLRLLDEHRVTNVHKVEILNDVEAMELFNWHAFREVEPSEVYVELSRLVVGYTQGLPLALEVLGSSLYGRKEHEWKEVLERLKRCPNKKITDILKVSYDDLEYGEEKTIFLDMAFFLKGKDRDEVTKFLKACGFSAYISVQTLIKKSLVYDFGGILEMHNLLKEMGIQIALKNSSRLCIQQAEDIHNFFGNKRACNVEILLLDFHGEEEVALKFLEDLTELRILIVRNGRVTKMPKKISNTIRWLEWYNCPISSQLLPTGLVVLKMPCTSIIYKSLSKVQKFVNLSRMNFRDCMYLKKTISFPAIPLEVLDLSWSEKLEKIESLGNLNKLRELYLKGCCRLTSLPNLVENQRLVRIDLYRCSNLENLPNLPVSLESLFLRDSKIKEIPRFIGDLENLHTIDASNCKNIISVSNNIYYLPRLKLFFLSNCPNLSNSEYISMCSSNLLSSTYILDLSENKFVSLPTNTLKFSHITFLNLDYCKLLVEIPELPSRLKELIARNCISLVRFSQFQFGYFTGNFSNCRNLATEEEMESWREMLQNEEQVNSWRKYIIVLPGNTIPEWFSHVIESEANTPCFKLPLSVSNDTVIGIAWCAVLQPNPECTIHYVLEFKIRMGKWEESIFLIPESGHMWFGYINAVECNFSQAEETFCEFSCNANDAVAFERFALHFIYKSKR